MGGFERMRYNLDMHTAGRAGPLVTSCNKLHTQPLPHIAETSVLAVGNNELQYNFIFMYFS
jgi:hypothetical protein